MAAQFRSDLPRWCQLVTADWLARFLGGEPVAAAPAGSWCLYEVDCGAPGDFLRAHIPGAGYSDTARRVRDPCFKKLPDTELLRLLQGLGIRHDSTVILYGRNTCAAARAAQLMLYAGVSMSIYQYADGTMLPAATIERFWAEAGIQADRPIVFYCGTGWRASLAFFYAWLMGWEQISVFDGGWLEWSSKRARDQHP